MFKQFGLTIALSVCISGIVALTLTPVMCAALLKSEKGNKGPGAFARGFDKLFGAVTGVFPAGWWW
jgi:multidrug efflux pump subunit AcrB